MSYGRSPDPGCCGCFRQLLLQALISSKRLVTSHMTAYDVHVPLMVLEQHDGELQRDALPILANARHRQEVTLAVVALAVATTWRKPSQ